MTEQQQAVRAAPNTMSEPVLGTLAASVHNQNNVFGVFSGFPDSQGCN